MHEQNDYINSWAEKLQEVTIPPLPESWMAMESLLDKELPVTRSKNYMRWIMLLLLLLLLLGVCNYHGFSPNKVALKSDKGSLPVSDKLSHNAENNVVSASANKKNTTKSHSINGIVNGNHHGVTETGTLKKDHDKQERIQADKQPHQL